MILLARDRRAILLGAVGLLVILAARLAIIPWMDSWVLARGQLDQTGQQLLEIQPRIRRVLNQRRRLEQRYGPAVNKPLEDLARARISLLKSVQGVLRNSGLKPSDYQPQRPRVLQEVPGVQLVSLQIRGKCNVSQLLKSLAGMTNAETLLIVDWFSVANDEKKPGKLEVTMMIATLAEKQEEGS